MQGEIWRDVPSVPGILVSSEGRVMVAPYRGEMPNGGARSLGGEPHWGIWDRANARFVFRVRGKTYKVHRLVAEAFHGPAPFENAVAMHCDENAANNRAANLEWGTQKDNMNAPGYIEYMRNRTRENGKLVKVTPRTFQ